MEIEFTHFFSTFTTLLLTMIIVVIGTIISIRINDKRTLIPYFPALSATVILALLRVSEMYAPTGETYEMNILLQNIVIVTFLLAWIFEQIMIFVFLKLCKLKTILISSIFSLIILVSLCLQPMYKDTYLYDLMPSIIGLFILVYNFLIFQSFIVYKPLPSLKNIITGIGDCTLVLDSKNNIMDLNLASFSGLFKQNNPNTYEEFILGIFPYVLTDKLYKDSKNIVDDFDNNFVELDMLILEKNLTFQKNMSVLKNDKNENIGRIISFHDITEENLLILELEHKKHELELLNEELKNYLTVVQKLEESKEKEALVLKIQNSIGHEIMELLSVLEVVRIKKPDISDEELQMVIDSCRNIIGKIRESVNALIYD